MCLSSFVLLSLVCKHTNCLHQCLFLDMHTLWHPHTSAYMHIQYGASSTVHTTVLHQLTVSLVTWTPEIEMLCFPWRCTYGHIIAHTLRESACKQTAHRGLNKLKDRRYIHTLAQTLSCVWIYWSVLIINKHQWINKDDVYAVGFTQTWVQNYKHTAKHKALSLDEINIYWDSGW